MATISQQTSNVNTLHYRFEGPFESSYSLAVVNREMARALERLRPGSVALYATEGPGDYEPDLSGLQHDPEIIQLWERHVAATSAPPEVTLRNLYPPRVSDMAGKLHVMNNYAWEESVFPGAYVDAFNQHLQMLAVTSQFVRKVMVDSGVTVPIVVTGNGVDHILRYPVEPVPLPTDKAFRFLHVSSCFPRKGVDVLLDAYTRMFSCHDDVLLIIKTFPNPHNTVEQQIRVYQARNPDCPAIHVISAELSMGQLNSLYAQAHALVAPSRGEGFGMPMAEAMLWDVPVIVTGYGGHTDFCTPDTAWLIDYTFAKAQTHMQQFDSLWVEPSAVHLATLMRGLYEQFQTPAGQVTIKARTRKARQTIEANWGWQPVAERLLGALDDLQAAPPLAPVKPKVAWLTTWNTRCGIASYSAFLLPHLSGEIEVLANTHAALLDVEGDSVTRCWTALGVNPQADTLDTLQAVLLAGNYRSVVIQFNYAFFDLAALGAKLSAWQADGIAVYLFFHATRDLIQHGVLRKSLRELGSALQGCCRLFVHGVEDVNRLKRFGCVDNVTLIPHGVMYEPDVLARPRRGDGVFKIAAYGFLLPGKGIPELIRAFGLLLERFQNARAHYPCQTIRLELFNALYPGGVSEQEAQQCAALIEAIGGQSITLHTTYHTDQQTLEALSACDVVVFPYQQTGESSSAAVRMGLASGRPVVCTPLAIFDDVAEVVHFLPDTGPEAIATGLEVLLREPAQLQRLHESQHAWLQAHAWSSVAKRLDAILSTA